MSYLRGKNMANNMTIQKIVGILLQRLKFIVIASIVSTILFFSYSTFFIAPQYATSTMIFVQNYDSNSSGTVNDENRKIYNSDISGSANLAGICVTLFQNSDELTALYGGCGVSYSTNNFFITISVSGSDAQQCANVANQLAERAESVFKAKFQYGQLGLIRAAQVPGAPYYPDNVGNGVIGFIVGLAASCVISILLELIDTTIKVEDDMQALYGIPVFAEIPDFDNQG